MECQVAISTITILFVHYMSKVLNIGLNSGVPRPGQAQASRYAALPSALRAN